MTTACQLTLLFGYFALFLLQGSRSEGGQAFRHNPVILIPGNGGNQLWARLRGTEGPWFCQSSSGDEAQLLWLRMSALLYPAVKCLAYNLMLRKRVDADLFPITATQDNVGVESFVPGFGSVDTMLWIADWQLKSTAYFATLVERLVDKHGFLRNSTIRGAPYDFRKAPDEFGDYFEQLKHLIEATYDQSGDRRIVLVCHSMGGKLALHFLHLQPQAWRDKYIKHFVAVGAAFGGVPASMLALMSGYGLGIPLIRPLWFRPVQRSWPSTHYLMPHPAVYPSDRPLVTAPDGATYTLANVSALFHRVGYPEGYADYARFSRLTNVTQAPGVPTTCVFGALHPTPGELRWSATPASGGGASAFADSQPTDIAWDSGDGTVAADTADLCRRWSRDQMAPIRVVQLSGAQHMAMLSDERFVELVTGVATDSEH